jgi:nitric oxide dioxygenase
VLASRVERIAQKHVGLHILPEHYHFVAEALLGAIKDVLGEAATEEVLEAWGEAYWFLADLLTAREANIYARLAAASGGWNGWRDFTVESTQPESEVIRSFILVPADGGPVMRHRPGQYLTFALDVPGARMLKRNYSISSAPDSRSYRISVKREARPGVPPGVASNWLHDQAGPGTMLKVAPPAGEFFLNEKDDSSVVLLSGGVGLTPMMSMLETIARSGDGRPTWYIHGAENGRVHAMGEHVRELASRAGNITVRTYYNLPEVGDEAGRHYDERGFISADWLARNTPDQRGRLLPLRAAAVPARDGRRARTQGRTAAQHPLRVLRPCRRAARRLRPFLGRRAEGHARRRLCGGHGRRSGRARSGNAGHRAHLGGDSRPSSRIRLGEAGELAPGVQDTRQALLRKLQAKKAKPPIAAE